ncbi:cytochrome c oxidase subunit II [Alphaproteobacteria bacterium HT1-32]|nr:cytochrome c oxidase subunit II [Alphaproteobacteria bacterium HT1-32]
MKPLKALKAVFSFAAVALTSTAAFAQQPHPWQFGLQAPATPVAEDLQFLHNIVLNSTITIITLFVLALMIYVVLKFNRKANPNPGKTTHHVGLEIAWTLIPVAILVVLAVPSAKLLYKQDRAVDAEMTIKAVGNQWYWTFEYADLKNADGEVLSFDAIMKKEDELQPGEPRLLAVDNNVVVPVGTKIRVLVTAADVLHSFTIPSFGFKTDAVPGRLNETWFMVNEGKEGIYYGQCSELCGKDHAFMPVAVEVVSKETYAAWAKKSLEAGEPQKVADIRNEMKQTKQVAALASAAAN